MPPARQRPEPRSGQDETFSVSGCWLWPCRGPPRDDRVLWRGWPSLDRMLESTAFYMERRPQTIRRRVARAALGGVGALGMAILMTWPLATGFGSLGRTRD